MKHTILITGAAGYVGAMLVEQLAKHPDVERIIGLDKEPVPEVIAKEPKLLYLQANTSDETWQASIREAKPDVVVHAAWQIRELYGNRALSWKWNVIGSDAVFNFSFGLSSVERLIHFSTVASYGAEPSNSTDHFYKEDEPFRTTDYLYAEEKRVVEERLRSAYNKSDKHVSVAVVRPASITGPRGRFGRFSFGLQSSLSGGLHGRGSLLYELISLWVSWVPATPKWLRQYVHEDDVVGIVERLALGPVVGGYEAFNLCPPGSAVSSTDMARVVGKHVLPVYPWMVRLAFFCVWHITRGRIPTSPGTWKGYSYPIAVDGSKVTHMLGYQYHYGSLDAIRYTTGTYEYVVPENVRTHK